MKTRSLAIGFALAGTGAIVACGGNADGISSLYAPAEIVTPPSPDAPPDQSLQIPDGGALSQNDDSDAAPDAPITKSCATATANAARQPVYMAMILDGSGSMNSENKWKAVVPALDGFIDGIAKKNDTTMAVGLTVFSDDGDPWQGTGDYTKEDVPMGIVNAAQQAAFHARIDNTTPHYQTPTFPALSGTYPQLEAYAPKAPIAANGKRVLVLLTDGTPYIVKNKGDMPDTAAQQTNSLALTTKETAKGILTFVIGVGELDRVRDDTGALLYDAQFLGALASAGGAARAACDPNELTDVTKMCHMQITPSLSKSAADLQGVFTAALNQIRATVMSCEFALESTGDIDPNRVNVVYTNGAGVETQLVQDAANGWTYDNPTAPTKVVLNGASCTTAKADPDGKVHVILGCQSVVAMTK